MASISARSAHKYVMSQLERMESGYEIELLSFKKDRSVVVMKVDDGKFRIREEGYLNGEKDLDKEALSKELKKAIEREFPRSNTLFVSSRKS
jgi:hypothetical protein